MYERFEKLIQERGITPYRVAKETGIPQATFTDWKKGRSNPKIEKLQKMADYFGVTVDYLTGRTEYPNIEVFQKEPNKVITYQKGQKKEAAPFMEQLQEDRQKLFDDIMNLNDEDFQTAKDLLDVILRRRGGSNQ